MKKGQPSNCQEVRQSLFFIAVELFWRCDDQRGHGYLTFERGSVCKSGSRVHTLILACIIIDTSTIDSRESQFRSSHRYAQQSAEHFIDQFKS